MKHLFWKCYFVFVTLLAFLSGAACYYVNNILQEYEISQPELVVEQQMACIEEAIKNDTIENIIEFQEFAQAEYDKEISELNIYRETLRTAKEFSYSLKTGGYSETELSYQILADNTPVAIVTLESSNEVTKLGILKIMDWEVSSIKPILTLSHYEYTIQVPQGSVVIVNEHILTDFILSDTKDWIIYKTEKLYSEPDIQIFDPYGYEAYYDINNNVVTPILHTYDLSIPASYSIFVNNLELEKPNTSTVAFYNILTACEYLKIQDPHGNEMLYDGTQKIHSLQYEINIPSNYTFTVNGESAEKFLISQEENPLYQYCREYVEMPKQNTYILKDYLYRPELCIYDNLGILVDFSLQNGTVYITEQTGSDSVPDVFTSDGFDALELAKKWSLFMTNDLSGGTKGFDTIKKYLIKDSYMYQVAYKWSTGIDSTLTSAHRTSDNYFTEESVSNFKQYSENVYSFHASFIKHMYLYKSKKWVKDEMNSTFYVMRTEDGNWVILDIQEVLSVG